MIRWDDKLWQNRHGGKHQSLLEPLAFMAAMPRENTFLATFYLFRIPVVGLVIQTVGAMPVRREEANLSLIFALLALVMGISMATATLVAQYFGAKQFDRVRRTISNSLILLVLMGTVLTAISIPGARKVLSLINAPAVILPLASLYLGIFLTGLIFSTFLYNAAGAISAGTAIQKRRLDFWPLPRS